MHSQYVLPYPVLIIYLPAVSRMLYYNYNIVSYMLRTIIAFSTTMPGTWWLVWDHLPVSSQCSRQGRTKWMGGSCPYHVSCAWSTCKQFVWHNYNTSCSPSSCPRTFLSLPLWPGVKASNCICSLWDCEVLCTLFTPRVFQLLECSLVMKCLLINCHCDAPFDRTSCAPLYTGKPRPLYCYTPEPQLSRHLGSIPDNQMDKLCALNSFEKRCRDKLQLRYHDCFK